MRYLALLLISAALAGCSSPPQRPAATVKAPPGTADDQVVRGVGNLRKLLVLPVVVEQGNCDWPDVAADLDEAAIRFLRDWKGYEPVRPADLEGAWVLARQLGTWQMKDPGAGKPPADLRARLMVAGEEAAADGVLVVHASPECPRGTEGGLLTLPARLAGSLNRNLSAGVYEVERGALVWHNQIRPAGWDPGRYGAQPPPRFETRQAGESLFAPIENAVPAVLKAPARPRKAAVEQAAPTVVVTPAREPTPLAPTPLPAAPGTQPEPLPTPAVAPPPAPVSPPPAVEQTPPPSTERAGATPPPVAHEAGSTAPADPRMPMERAVEPPPGATGEPTPALPSPERPATPGPTEQPGEPTPSLPSPEHPATPSQAERPGERPPAEPIPALPSPERPTSPGPTEQPDEPAAPEPPPAPGVEPPLVKAPIRA